MATLDTWHIKNPLKDYRLLHASTEIDPYAGLSPQERAAAQDADILYWASLPKAKRWEIQEHERLQSYIARRQSLPKSFYTKWAPRSNIQMKRTNPYSGNWSRARKIQRAAFGNKEYNPLMPAIVNRPSRSYVPRTPGGQITSERKYFDTSASNRNVQDTSATFASAIVDPITVDTLFAPIQGNDISNREGRNCHVYSITVRGTIEIPAQVAQQTSDLPPVMRIILVMDKQTNGSVMQSDQLISSTANPPGTFMYQNTANFGRFQILKEKFILFQNYSLAYHPNSGGATQITQGSSVKFFKLKYTFKNPIKINFNSTNGGTIADIVDNSFHFIIGTDTGVLSGGSPQPVVSYQARTSFIG